MALSKQLLDKLACPRCKGVLEAVPETTAAGATTPLEGLGCSRCDLLYEVKAGIPVLIAEQARRWSDAPRP